MNLNKYIGMLVAEATTSARAAGWEVVVEDSKGPIPLNCEYRSGRVTFHVVAGNVVEARIG